MSTQGVFLSRSMSRSFMYACGSDRITKHSEHCAKATPGERCSNYVQRTGEVTSGERLRNSVRTTGNYSSSNKARRRRRWAASAEGTSRTPSREWVITASTLYDKINSKKQFTETLTRYYGNYNVVTIVLAGIILCIVIIILPGSKSFRLCNQMEISHTLIRATITATETMNSHFFCTKSANNFSIAYGKTITCTQRKNTEKIYCLKGPNSLICCWILISVFGSGAVFTRNNYRAVSQRLIPKMSGWPSGPRRCVQVAVQFSGRGFESHFWQ